MFGFKKMSAFQSPRHQADQRLVRRGHLDYHAETWQPLQVLQVLREGVMHRRRGVRSDDFDSAIPFILEGGGPTAFMLLLSLMSQYHLDEGV